MGLLTQFSLLLWKNFTLRKRQKVRLLVEILWPLFLFVILVAVRTTTKPVNKGQCHYPNKAMPSAGLLPWLQGMMCNIDNPCYNDPTPGETPGQVNNFNNSIASQILINVQNLLLELSNGQGYLESKADVLVNSTNKALKSLDFQNDPIGSFSMFLCGKKPSFNSTFRFPTSDQQDTMNSSFQNSQDSDPFCTTLIDTMVTTPSMQFLWKNFRPLLKGKVLYTPDTPAARLLVEEANATFMALAAIKEFADSWGEDGPFVWGFVENGTAVVNESSANSNNSSTDTPPTSEDAYNDLTHFLKLLSKVLGCFELNKFEAVPTEYELVTEALEHLKNDTFWAGIVFENLQPNSSSIPPYLKYKIRMDVEEVQRTDKVENRLWSPGANDNPYENLRYIWGGFAYLEDIIDHASIRLQTSTSQPLGVYVQQMPYPCYVDDPFIQSIGAILPMFLILAFMSSVAMTIKGLVLEKELRLKEVLRGVGIQNGALWSSTFTETMILLTVPCVLMSVMVKVSGEQDAQ